MFLFSLVGLATASAQPNLFVDSGQNLGTASSTAVALGDIDGDNDLDAFVANFDGASTVWINQGGGSFADSGQNLGSGTAMDVALGDLDGDNDLDAFVVLDAFSNSNQVWINQGGIQEGTEGVFQLNGQTIGDSLSSAVALGDVDGDGDLDAYVARTVGTADKVWINQGGDQAGTAGQFADSGQTLGSDSGVDVALGDVDGDNDLDAFLANGAANKVWINQGGVQAGTEGQFSDSGQTLGSVLSLSVALGDVDGDNDLDAFVGNSAADKVWINQGGVQAGTAGVFADSGQSLGSSPSRGVALGDVDGDLDLDAFIAAAGVNKVWINQGGTQGGTEGQFSDSGLGLNEAFSEDVALGDVDADLDLDAFVANGVSLPNKVWRNTTIEPMTEINPFGWQLQFADLSGSTGRGVSLALDGSGHPHISYIRFLPVRSGLDYAVMYSRWDGVRWLKQLVEQVPSIQFGALTSIALDGAGNPRIAYSAGQNASDQDLRYAAWDGSQWQLETADGSGEVEARVSLALDSAGEPHISYRHDDDEALYYVSRSGSTWQAEQVEQSISSFFAEHHALAMDPSDRPHIAYYDGDQEEFKYAMRDIAGWQIEIIDDASVHTSFDGFVDLVVDASGVPHVSYVGDFAEQIRYARKDVGGWQIEIAVNTGALFLSGDTSLALDSAGRPHISYAPEDGANNHSLRYVRKDATGWQSSETVDDEGSVGLFNALALDANDNPRIAYYDAPYGDLRYVSWDRRWQSRTIDPTGISEAPAITVSSALPTLGYYDLSAGLVRSAQWETQSWVFDPLDFINNPGTEVSIANAGPSNQNLSAQAFASYYHVDNQRLMFAAWNGVLWVLSPIDSSADVGRYNRLLFVGGRRSEARIAYWDASNLNIKLALFNTLDPSAATIRTNLLGPSLDDSTSGPLAATVLANGDIGISYYDGNNDDLRLATWHEVGFWSDQPVATAGDVGRYHDIATDGGDGFPVVAFHDASAQNIQYGHRGPGGVWQFETAVANVAAVSALALDLGLDSRLNARIFYIDDSDGGQRVATLRDGNWFLETAAELASPADLDAAVGLRPHLAVTEDGVGLQHWFRTATVDVVSTPLQPPPPLPPPAYNPLDACLAVLDLFLGGDDDDDDSFSPSARSHEPGHEPLTDQTVFDLWHDLFALSADGRRYIELYRQHGAEMGKLGLADPQLLWDAFGALQNFMPGLEAIVTGHGDDIIISQQMVDDALDIWQRLAAAGSVGLAATIAAELALHNDLQNFVGMSYDEWVGMVAALAPGCSGSEVFIQNHIFSTDTNCAASNSLAADTAVVVNTGVSVEFRAPRITLGPGFNVATGANFNAGQ